jgi:hypothetical protein
MGYFEKPSAPANLILPKPVAIPQPRRACEDCGESTPTRRFRCRDCGKLVCAWCSGHVHRTRAN